MTKRASTTVRWMFVMIVLGIGAIQVALACHYYNLVFADDQQRLPYKRFVSGTVCEHEVVFLVDTHCESRHINWSDEQIAATEEVHCNLRTGQVTSVPSSLAVRHLVSDGETLWRLPNHKRVSDDLFVWGGRPAVINPGTYGQLLEFVDGEWKETEEFLIVPYGSPGRFTTTIRNGRHVIEGLHYLRNESNVLYHPDVTVGTRQEFKESNRRFQQQFSRRLSDSKRDKSIYPLQDAGWQKTEFDRKDLNSTSRPYHLGQLAFGIWNEDSHVCLMCPRREADGTKAFQWYRSEANHGFQTIEVRSPIRWPGAVTPGWPHVDRWRNGLIKSIEGEIFIVCINESDDRLHVLQYKNGQLRIIGQRGSPFFARELRRVAPFIQYVVLVPMLLLSVAACIAQYFQGKRSFAFGNQSIALASILRRGFARAIDMTIPVAATAAAIILHPDVIGWWFQVNRDWSGTLESAKSLVSSKGTWPFLVAASKLFVDIFSAPLIHWMVVLAVVVWISQVVWQGMSGKTLGKWVLGLTARRATLRPCGVARSLLREILLVVDSLLLICWLPGVISILITRNSQRIGDLWSDTIVTHSVRVPRWSAVSILTTKDRCCDALGGN